MSSTTSSTPDTGTLRLGTRGSALARTQSEHVAAAVRAHTGREVELVEVRTEGDASREPLAAIGGTGVFVSALREALLRGDVDVAVHSLKDLPTAPAPDVTMAAVPLREDPRDAVCARDGLTLGELPVGSLVGTGSPRRHAQLEALGLGLQVTGLRGNVDTRLRRVGDDLDAVVLARAGLARLGREEEITETLDPFQMLPAPGQGALAVECRTGDTALAQTLAEALDDRATRAAVLAERTLLADLEAGCSAPVGALAEVVEGEDGEELWLRAVALSPDGVLAVRRSATGDPAHPEELGRRVAAEMLEDGAGQLLGAADPESDPEPEPDPETARPNPPARTTE